MRAFKPIQILMHECKQKPRRNEKERGQTGDWAVPTIKTKRFNTVAPGAYNAARLWMGAGVGGIDNIVPQEDIMHVPHFYDCTQMALLNSGDLCRSLQKCVFGSSPDSILPCFITVFKSVVPSTGLFKSETSHPSTLVVNFGDQPTRIYQSRLCRQCKL